MASCPKCDGFSQRFNILDGSEYQNIVRQLIEIVSQGTFLLVRASQVPARYAQASFA